MICFHGNGLMPITTKSNRVETVSVIIWIHCISYSIAPCYSKNVIETLDKLCYASWERISGLGDFFQLRANKWVNLDNATHLLTHLMQRIQFITLRWRHNGRHSVSNHQPHDCLLNRLFRRRSKKTSKLCVTGLCVGNSPGTGEFPAKMASNAENVSIWWRHHADTGSCALLTYIWPLRVHSFTHKNPRIVELMRTRTLPVSPFRVMYVLLWNLREMDNRHVFLCAGHVCIWCAKLGKL